MPEPLVITIDGPAGAGKSTVAQKLAERLGLTYVDSGATYRAAALKVLNDGIDPLDEAAVAKLIGATEVRIAAGDGAPRVLVDGNDVTAQLRTPEVTLAAAQVSRLPEVRAKIESVGDCGGPRQWSERPRGWATPRSPPGQPPFPLPCPPSGPPAPRLGSPR